MKREDEEEAAAIAGHKPGDAVQLVFVREGKVRRTTLILAGF